MKIVSNLLKHFEKYLNLLFNQKQIKEVNSLQVSMIGTVLHTSMSLMLKANFKSVYHQNAYTLVEKIYQFLTDHFLSLENFNQAVGIFEHFFQKIKGKVILLKLYGNLISTFVDQMLKIGINEFFLPHRYTTLKKLNLFLELNLPKYKHFFSKILSQKPSLFKPQRLILSHFKTKETTIKQENKTSVQIHFHQLQQEILDQILKYHWNSDFELIDLRNIFQNVLYIQHDQCASNFVVMVKNDVMIIDEIYGQILFNSVSTCYTSKEIEEILAKIALYAVHEIIHISQKIDNKHIIEDIRKIGAEKTLMLFDLNADHLAAILVSRIFAHRNWTLSWLKNIQGYSLVDFPITHKHLEGAIQRKKNRLLSSRADYLYRKHQTIDQIHAYHLIEYSRIEGHVLLIQVAPFYKVVSCVAVTNQEIEVFDAIAEVSTPEIARDHICKIDDLIENLFFL